jgi:hypothetical protein
VDGSAVTSTTVADVWREHRRWSNGASRLKRKLVLWRGVALGAAVAGAVLATLAAQLGVDTAPGFWSSVAAAASLAVAPLVRATRLGRSAVETWTRARSASEGLKAEMYLALTGTPPYGGDDGDTELDRRAQAILSDVDDLVGVALGQPDRDKPVPDIDGVDSYLERRVRAQIEEYYEPGAQRQARRLAAFRGVEYALALLGAVLGAVAAVARVDALAAWVAVVTTVTAAVTAHIAAARYEQLMISYAATARQLRYLVRGWSRTADRGPESAARLVRECEDAISRENESWMAAWTRDSDRLATSDDG